MIYNQYPYNIYNPNYLEKSYLQMLRTNMQKEAQNKHFEQQMKIKDMVKAISDYCEAAREIEPQYWQEATVACVAELCRQISIDQQRAGGYDQKYK